MKLDDSRTKIIATMGPACADKKILKEMILEGVDVCRLNFSHGSYEQHDKTISTIREINKELGLDIAILADLQGPKLRIGDVEGGKVKLEEGALIKFVSTPCMGTAEQVYMSYEEFPKDVTVGDEILIDDGTLKLKVISSNTKDTVTAQVIYGGFLGSKKGVNLPHTKISLPSMTEKDIEDAYFALSRNVDWIALSFVRAVSDIIELKQLIKRKKKDTYVIAKIEKPDGVRNIEQIIQVTDAIMVARGDLGVEMPFDSVPMIQKNIVKLCLDNSVPIIIATQMMDSMINNFRPTRAEANDVANAVIDGVDTLMLSGETSVGKYPIETIRSMHKIIQYTEENGYTYNRGKAPSHDNPRLIPDSICHSASRMAKQIGAKAIITITDKGHTAKRISGHRPDTNIFAFTPNEELLSVLSLYWGVRAFYYDKNSNIDDAIEYTIEVLKAKKLVESGDIVIHVASTPMSITQSTNMLKITKVS